MGKKGRKALWENGEALDVFVTILYHRKRGGVQQRKTLRFLPRRMFGERGEVPMVS